MLEQKMHNGVPVVWEAQPKQRIALKREEFETLYGGARGGGKTDAGIAWLLYPYKHPRYRGLVIRRNADDLKDWIDRARILYRMGNIGAEFVGSPAEIRFRDGGVIRTGHLKDENAYEKYQGHEYHRILIEELTHIPDESSYLKLISSCRSTITELRPRVFATTNPGGDGHKWVKRRFIDVATPGTPFIDPKTGRTRIFIPARVEDNVHLMEKDPEYVKFLDGLPEGLRQAWREGSWDLQQEGVVYAAEWRELVAAGRLGPHVYYDSTLPTFSSWDFGIGDATAIGIYQVSPADGSVRLVDYYEANNEPLQHFIDWIKGRGYKLTMSHGDPSGRNRNFVTGRSIFDDLAKADIMMYAKPVSVEDKIHATRVLIGKLWVSPHCEKFIDAITSYRFEKDSNDEWKRLPVHDWSSHCMDQLGYFAVNYQTPKKPLSNVEKKLRALREARAGEN